MSVLKEEDLSKPSFVIEANPKYDFSYKSSDVYMLQNIAEEVTYSTADNNSSGITQLSFSIKNPSAFLDRGVTVNIGEIPFTIERSGTAPASAITGDNYVNDFFDGYQWLALRQFAFSNCIQSIKVNIDGTVLTCDSADQILQIVSRYYDETVVNDKLDASLPDLMAYDNYGATATPVKSVTENGQDFYIKPSISNTFSPFGTMGTAEYSSRQPTFIFEKTHGDWTATTGNPGFTAVERNTIDVRSSGFQCFIPFSVFGVPGDKVPLVGVKSIEIMLQLKVNWWNYLFSTAKMWLRDIKLTSGFTKLLGSINYRSYLAPQYITSNLNTQNMEYTIGLPTLEMHNSRREVKFAAGVNRLTVPSMDFDLRAVPKHFYISAKTQKSGGADTAQIADVFARIDSARISLANKDTTFWTNPSGAYTIAKSNGLNLSKECMYLSGFPLKVDVSDDLGSPTNTLVGSQANSNRLIINNLTLTNVAYTGKEVTYEVTLIPVYDGLLTYRNGSFTQYESLINSATGISTDLHASNLYNGQLRTANVVGGSLGSLFGSLVPSLKKGLRGVWNVGRQFATNKDFRDGVTNAFNGKQVGWNQPVTKGSGYHVTGGAYSDHTPILGGSRQYNSF